MQAFGAAGDEFALMLVGFGHDEGVQIAAFHFGPERGNAVRVGAAPLQAVVEQGRFDAGFEFAERRDDIVAAIGGDQGYPGIVVIAGGRGEHTAQDFPRIDHIDPCPVVAQQVIQIPVKLASIGHSAEG